ncbi:MAG: hypothetical protein Q4Q03_02725, partial [Bowdeniella nasicola]|nr:hypothetical protein [Bowdeniella nasicola]
HFRIPTDTAALLTELGSAPPRAQIVRIQALHGGAGASHLARAWAYLAARDGLRVILVDTDPLAPTTQLFDTDNPGWCHHPQSLLPLRFISHLPRWHGVRILAGNPPNSKVRDAVVTQLQAGVDLIIIDEHAGANQQVNRAHWQLAVGMADWRTAHAWRYVGARAPSRLVVRSSSVARAQALIDTLGPDRGWVWKSERARTEVGDQLTPRLRTTTMRLVRELSAAVRRG